MLVYPQEVVEVRSKSNKEIAINSMDFGRTETQKCWCGGEDGSVSLVQLHNAGQGCIECVISRSSIFECD